MNKSFLKLKILDWYFLRKFLYYFFTCYIIFIFFYFIVSLMLDTNYFKVSFTIVLKQYIYSLPPLTYFLTGPTILLSTLFTFSFYSKSSELVAIQACGVSSYRLFFSLILTTLFLGIVALFISDRLTEKYFLKAVKIKYTQVERKTDFSLTKTNELWYRSGNLILSIDTFDNINNVFYNLTVYKMDENFKLLSRTDAEKCTFLNGEWVAHNVVEYLYENPQSDFPIINKLGFKIIQINKKPEDFNILTKRKFGFYSIKELKRIIIRHQQLGAPTSYYKTHLYSKFSHIFTLLIMVFLAIPFAFTNYKKISNSHNIIIGLVVSFLFGSLHSTFMSFGSSGVLYPFVAAWAANVVFIFIGAYIFWHKREEWQF